MIPTRHSSKKWLWLTLLVTAVIVLIVQIPLLLDPQYVNEDLRFFYWLHRFTDPSLFEADSLLGYQFAEINIGSTTLLFNKVSLLYGTLYAVSSQFLSPFIFSKLLIFPLALMSSYYLFRIGEYIADPFTAFLLTSLFTLIAAVPYSSVSLAVGLPRTFTLPLLLAMLYYMMIDNHLGMAVVLVTALFYPPGFLTILFTYGVKYGVESLRRRRLALTGKQVAVFSAALLISILLLLPATLTGLNTVPADAEVAEEMTVFSSPLFGDEGRYPLLKPSPLTGNGGLLDGGLIGLYSLILLITLIPIALVLRRHFNRLPVPFWYLAAASLIGFGISWLAILFTPSATFHMPSRYMRGTIFIMSLILVCINGPLAIRAGAKYLANNRTSLGGLIFVTGIVGFGIVYFSDVSTALTAVFGLLLAVIVVLIWGSRRRLPSKSKSDGVLAVEAASGTTSLRIQSILVGSLLVLPLLIYMQGPNNFYRPEPDGAALINFAKTLPQDTLISGYPCFLNDIPLYSQRMVLFSCETESRDMNMMTAALDAYFAETGEAVLAFCRQYDVDYIVASPDSFTETFRNQAHIIFEPLNGLLKQKLEGRNTFALNDISENSKLFQNESFFVLPCTAEALAAAQ